MYNIQYTKKKVEILKHSYNQITSTQAGSDTETNRLGPTLDFAQKHSFLSPNKCRIVNLSLLLHTVLCSALAGSTSK